MGRRSALLVFFFSSRRRHTRWPRDWSSDVCSSDLGPGGKFQIWYTVAEFSRTPFSPVINIELVPGPDLYFRIEGPGGVVLLDEPPITGRTPGRQNVGPCFCA